MLGTYDFLIPEGCTVTFEDRHIVFHGTLGGYQKNHKYGPYQTRCHVGKMVCSVRPSDNSFRVVLGDKEDVEFFELATNPTAIKKSEDGITRERLREEGLKVLRASLNEWSAKVRHSGAKKCWRLFRHWPVCLDADSGFKIGVVVFCELAIIGTE